MTYLKNFISQLEKLKLSLALRIKQGLQVLVINIVRRFLLPERHCHVYPIFNPMFEISVSLGRLNTIYQAELVAIYKAYETSVLAHYVEMINTTCNK